MEYLQNWDISIIPVIQRPKREVLPWGQIDYSEHVWDAEVHGAIQGISFGVDNEVRR